MSRGIAIIVVACGLCLLARSEAHGQVIRSCYNPDGQIRIVGPTEACKSQETLLEWNVKGPKGDKGDPGPPGSLESLTAGDICNAVFSHLADNRLRMATCASFFGLAKFVFLTSSMHWGSLGGLEGADAICQRDADAAGLAGSYKAWLSTRGVPVKDRMTHAMVPYVLPDAAFTVVATDWNQFASINHQNGITKNALGNSVAPFPGLGLLAWTGSTAQGDIQTAFSSPLCNDWTALQSGDSGVLGKPELVGDPAWSEFNTFRCDFPAVRLICVGQ